jgi:P4 family phage/plasmid primase-like protien
MSAEHSEPNTGARIAPTSLGWSPFHVAAWDYWQAGYFPIPLPINDKFPPPYGVPNELEVTEQQIDAWLNGQYSKKDGTQRTDTRPKNIGMVVPDGVAVFDVDGQTGLETLQELENQYGPLPGTWVTFRGDPERYHLWFAVPEGIAWPGKLGAGLDLIYRHYRYMVVPPSIHPTGAQYRWAFPNGSKDLTKGSGRYFPNPDEFTELPPEWLALSDVKGFKRRDRSQVDSRLWLAEYGKGEPCPEIVRVLKRHQKLIRQGADGGGMHDAMTNGVWAILAEVIHGHQGSHVALRELRNTFYRQAKESERRTLQEARNEWTRAIIGAIEKSAVERVRQGDPCEVEEAEKGKDPNRFFDSKYGLRARSLRESVEITGKLAVGPGRTIYRSTEGLWVPDGESEIYRRTESLLGQRYRPGHAANVRSVVENREPLITDEKQDTQYLNLPNGLLDWEEAKLYPHNPHIISTVRIPIEWSEEAECPVIDQFFNEVFPNDAVELAYEILGYMLFNDNPLHKAILLYGSGRNGKGTFIRLARMLVGHNNISAVTPQSLDSSQFSSAQLYGKLANLVGDVDPRIFKSTEQFKQLTGGDYMMAQHKHKDPFTFRCRALMIAAFNALPRSQDTTEGFFSRWVVVPFSAFFPAGKADPTLIDRLTAPDELQGLLRRAVGGLQQVMRRGRFTLPASVVNATNKFRREADPIRGFIDECIKADPHNFTPRSEVYAEYVAWSATNGFHPMAASRFYESFLAATAGLIQLRSVTLDGIRGFKGITFPLK